MAQPVWVLSVDLQTKTATFESGMASAAKSARGAFTEIKSGAGEMGGEVSGNMMEARHGVMLLGEEFGIHLPRALSTFIASIGPIGAAMEAAFPFLAIAMMATLFVEALVKAHEAATKLTEDQEKFGTAAQDAFNKLDEKLIQAQIRSDELHNNHLAALQLQLKLINMQSMADLAHEFDSLGKEADIVFDGLKSHWYTFGAGGTAAKASLDSFQAAYHDLLSHGKDTEASDLLQNKLDRETKILALQKEYIANSGTLLSTAPDGADTGAALSAQVALRKMGAGYTEDEAKAQGALVQALQDQVGYQGIIAATKKKEGENDKFAEAQKGSAEQSAAARQAAEAQLRMGESAVQADRTAANARLEIQRASIAERLANELDFANREYAVQVAGNQLQISALDKLSKEYPNALKALHDKALELTAQHEQAVAALTSKSAVEQAAKDLTDLEQAEKEKIEITAKGSADRLAAIEAALAEERSKNMQDLGAYRELLNQRVQVMQQMAEEEKKLQADAGREEAAQAEKMGQLMLAADKERQALLDSAHRMTDRERLAEEADFASRLYGLKLTEMQQEISALDKSGKDYLNKLRELQNKEKQLTQQHENEIAAIRDKANIEENQKVIAAAAKFNDQITAGLTQVLMGHKSFASVMASIGNEVVSGMIANAIKAMEANLIGKESDAARAARKAYNIGVTDGGPAGMVLGPLFATLAFATVSGFAGGGIVPGVGLGDTVPAMLTPGESVLPKGMTELLNNAARSGDTGGGTHYHVNTRVHLEASALDSDGMDTVLNKHADKLQKHFESTLRRMNR